MIHFRLKGKATYYILTLHVFDSSYFRYTAESPDTNEASGLLDINFRNQNYFWITNLTFLEAPAPVIRSVYPAEGRLL